MFPALHRISRNSNRVILFIVLIAPPVIAQDAQPIGVLWESTSQMTMEGMPFSPPPQTHKLCTPVEWSAPPSTGAEDRGCVNSDFVRAENAVTWTSTCTGPPAMNGQGRIEFEDEAARAYSGELRYVTPDGNVVIKLSGRAVGDCDNPR